VIEEIVKIRGVDNSLPTSRKHIGGMQAKSDLIIF
jgi:hypothetical protein